MQLLYTLWLRFHSRAPVTAHWNTSGLLWNRLLAISIRVLCMTVPIRLIERRKHQCRRSFQSLRHQCMGQMAISVSCIRDLASYCQHGITVALAIDRKTANGPSKHNWCATRNLAGRNDSGRPCPSDATLIAALQPKQSRKEDLSESALQNEFGRARRGLDSA
jgi:hypothetical protein